MAALAGVWAAAARAEQPLEVKRQDLEVDVHVHGTVVARDIIRLKSTIDGRVEGVDISTYSWAADGKPLGYLANREMAAILDAHATTAAGVLEDRWRRVYAPTPIECPRDCFVLRRFVNNKDWLRPKALLFEAALSLQLVGRVRPEDAHLIRDGQTLEFWPTDDPSRKLTARVTHYVIDIQGEKVEPGGSFTVELGPGHYLDPGTEWEGRIVPLTKRNVLVVPTGSLIRYQGAVYLPVRVSTGITTPDLTEITAGVESKRQILVIDDSRLKNAFRYKQEIDYDAINKRIEQDYLKQNPRAKREKLDTLPAPDQTYGDDPYSQ